MFGYKLVKKETEYLVIAYEKDELGTRRHIQTKNKMKAITFFCNLFSKNRQYHSVRFEKNGKDILHKVLKFLDENK